MLMKPVATVTRRERAPADERSLLTGAVAEPPELSAQAGRPGWQFGRQGHREHSGAGDHVGLGGGQVAARPGCVQLCGTRSVMACTSAGVSRIASAAMFSLRW